MVQSVLLVVGRTSPTTLVVGAARHQVNHHHLSHHCHVNKFLRLSSSSTSLPSSSSSAAAVAAKNSFSTSCGFISNVNVQNPNKRYFCSRVTGTKTKTTCSFLNNGTPPCTTTNTLHQRHPMSTVMASLQNNHEDTFNDNNDESSNNADYSKSHEIKQSKLSSVYDEMFEHLDNKKNSSSNNNNKTQQQQNHDHSNNVRCGESSEKRTMKDQKSVFYDEERDEHEMLFTGSNNVNQDYIDYITSFENQNPQLSSSTSASASVSSTQRRNESFRLENNSLDDNTSNSSGSSSSENMINNIINEATSTMMDELFSQDFPATLSLSNEEIQQTNDLVQLNHDLYAAQYRSSTTSKPIATTAAATTATQRMMKSNNNQQQQQQQQQQQSSRPEDNPNHVVVPAQGSLPSKATQPKSLSTIEDNTNNNSKQSSTKSSFTTSSRLSPPPQKVTTSEKEILQFTINQIQSQIYKLNNNNKFNIQSYKQVSLALFGVETESTNRNVLEGLTGNIIQHLDSEKNIAELAKLILEYRKLHSKLKKMEREEVNKANGSHVNHYNQNAYVATTASPTQMKTNDVSTVSSNKYDDTSMSSKGKNAKDIFLPNELTLGHKHHQEGRTAIEPLVLIDASAYIFRAYYSMPPIHRHDGEPTGATLGFCNMLNRLVLTPSYLEQNQNRGDDDKEDSKEDKSHKALPPRVVLVFDSKDGTNFRKELYPEYKANRKPCPIDLIPQFDFVRDAADAYGILQLEASGYEADDVIATIATKALEEGCFVNILSGDKDLMQLVTQDNVVISDDNNILEPCIQLIDPMNMVRVDYKGVIDKWGVNPERLGDVLALAGDTADNIPGVPGIGPKIAASLIEEYGSLEGIFENVDSIKQKARREKLKDNTEKARLSRQLVELERNVPLEIMGIPSHFECISDFRMEPLNVDRLIAFYDRMGFRDLKRRVQSRLKYAQHNKQSKPRVTSRLGEVYDAILEGKNAHYHVSQNSPPKGADPRVIVEDSIDGSFADQSKSTMDEIQTEDQKKTNLSTSKDRFVNQAGYLPPPDESEFYDVPF